MLRLALLFTLGLCGVLGDVVTLPRQLGSFPHPLPAFIEVHKFEDPAEPLVDRYTLYVSTFDGTALLQHDPVFYMRSPGRFLDDVPNWQLARLDNSAYWPNNPDILPSVIWTSGFLVPTKTAGKLQIYNMKQADPASTDLNIASGDDKDYSYHRVLWKDMDADGDLDALTARFHNGGDVKSLAWLENPGAPVKNWVQHDIILGGPDVHFRNVELTSAGLVMDCILAAEFWNQRATAYCIPSGAVDGWNEPNNIQAVVFDAGLGQPFDILVEDLNQDGKLDVLITAFDGKLGSVYVYEIPDDLFNGTWTRHTIADNFNPHFMIVGSAMSPGSPKTFYPSDFYANETLADGRQHKPWLILSGDDDGKCYILRPVSDEVDDWSYTKVVLLNTGGTTTGKLAAVDIDGDGYTEIIAAGYSANTIWVFTYAPL